MIIAYDKDGNVIMKMKDFDKMTDDELLDEEAKVASKLNTNPCAKDYLGVIHKEMTRRHLHE